MAYTSKIIKIYFWQLLSMILGFTSMLVVTPRLSKIQDIYGIYVICISLRTFLSYADIGFVTAGIKYASEFYARGEKKNVLSMIGFAGFILLIFSIFFFMICLSLSFFPQIIMKEIVDPEKLKIASKIILIVALFSPVLLFQRMLDIFYIIRLEDYIPKRYMSIASMITIASVFYFFSESKYDITGYFLFMNLMNLIVVVTSLFTVVYKYNYSLLEIIKAIKPFKTIAQKTWRFAITSFYTMIAWLLYYEIDVIAIGFLLGAKDVAVYSIPLLIMNFTRNIFATFYGPFNARFNHLKGVGDLNSLKDLYFKVIILTLPVTLFPVLALISIFHPFVMAWVGEKYLSSASVGIVLFSSYFMIYIQNPSGMVLGALEKNRYISGLATFNLIIFWSGILLTVGKYGIMSFAFFKAITFIFSGLFGILVMVRVFRFTMKDIAFRIYLPAIPSIMSIILLGKLFSSYYVPFKAAEQVILISSVTGGIIVFGNILYFIFSKEFRCFINNMLILKS